MKTIAIKGHKTRYKEVLEILETLGGKNTLGLVGFIEDAYYYINNDNIIVHNPSFYKTANFKIFTVEEFLEKYPYKVGDKVQHKWATSRGSVCEVEKMRWADDHIEYTVKRLWYWNVHYTFTAEDLQPFEEENMDKAVFNANAQCCDIMNYLIKKETMEERKYADLRFDVDQDDKLATEVTIGGDKITPPENYLIGKVTTVDNGLLVEFVKKQLQLPKTYEGCCTIMGFNSNTLKWNNFFNINKDTHPYIKHFDNLIENFCKLLICRDAYWKIAGEQMGLGKPWKPDYLNPTKEIRYFLFNTGITIKNGQGSFPTNKILIFPTAEMQDTFYENFKYLIESCKELL